MSTPPDPELDKAARALADRLNRILFRLEAEEVDHVYTPSQRPDRLSKVQAKYGRRRDLER